MSLKSGTSHAHGIDKSEQRRRIRHVLNIRDLGWVCGKQNRKLIRSVWRGSILGSLGTERSYRTFSRNPEVPSRDSGARGPKRDTCE